MTMYNSLQLREIFHLEFLRRFGQKIKPGHYALKGGTNLRFFFQSFRYSEDMNLDVSGIRVGFLRDTVMTILQSPSFQENLKSFGIAKVVPPNIARAKQTETTQRFKIPLLSLSGEDLFTKVEFSRRGFKGKVVIQPVSDNILRMYKIAPLLIPHYDIESLLMEKIAALAGRSLIQARDMFDLYILSSQYQSKNAEQQKPKKSLIFKTITPDILDKAHNNIFGISVEQFRDTVLFYLSPEDRNTYDSISSWDEIKLRVANLIEEVRKKYE